MKLEVLSNFYLVGGTALALHLGHRISVDLDLFTEFEFESNEVLNELQGKFNFVVLLQKEKNSLSLNFNLPKDSDSWVKVDFIKYPYPKLNKILEIDGIRLFSVEDIIPMKLAALSNRGAKKDFYDIYEILKRYSLTEVLDLFGKKFPNVEHFYLVKSLTYFDDAESDFDPISLNQISWVEVKTELVKLVKTDF